MSLDLKIALDATNLARFRRLMSVSRVMAAKSLTFTAEQAVPAWRVGNSVFHKRNTWIDRGVRMRAATPARLEAQVGTLDKYMGRHVIGLGDGKEGHLFIPMYARIGDAPTHTRERAMLRRMDSTQRKPFKITLHGETYIARRAGADRLPLIILGKIQDNAKVHPRLDAVGIVSGVVQAVFPTVYERLLLKWAETGKV